MRYFPKYRNHYKRWITALISLILAFTLCVPVYAEDPSEEAVSLQGFTELPGVGECLGINKENFPDDAFRACILMTLQKYGAGIAAKTGGPNPCFEAVSGNWFFSKAALPYVTGIDASDIGMKSAKGLEYFTALKELSVSKNSLTELDLRSNPEIARFACTFNSIELLDLRGNKALNPFDSSSFNMSFQKNTPIVLCDPGSPMERYCDVYLIPCTCSLMEKRSDLLSGKGESVLMVKEKADVSAILSSLYGGEKFTGFSVDNKDFAKISKKGMIRGKKEGSFNLSAKSADGRILSFPVKVENPSFSEKTVKSLSLNEVIYAEKLLKGTSYRPDGYLSSKEKVAEIHPLTGKIVVRGKGTTKITASYGNRKISFKLKVKIPYLNKSSMYLKTGKSFKLKLKGTKEKPVFSSSDESIVKVSPSTGEITGLAPGTAEVTALLKGVGYKCKVTVVSS